VEERRAAQHILKAVAKRARRWIHAVEMGTLRRTQPVSRHWGFDRGTPVDRYFIEKFLQENGGSIRGRVLEVKESHYTDRFGTAVQAKDVLDIDAGNPSATVVADLAAADSIPSNTFDCFILTQTLHLIYDLDGAIRHSHRILRPGGTLLATMPALSRIINGEGIDYDYWRVTGACASRLFGSAFGPENVEVRTYGNVLAGVAFLVGMAYEELTKKELEFNDPYFPLLVSVKAVKR